MTTAEWLKSKSSLTNGTALEHLQNLKTSEPLSVIQPEISTIKTSAQLTTITPNVKKISVKITEIGV